MSDEGQPPQPGTFTQNVSLEVTFQGYDEHIPQFVNFAQVSTDSTVVQLVLSQVVPPPVSGADEIETLKASGIKGHVINRLILNPQTARQLAEGIMAVLAATERQQEGTGSGES